MRMPRFSGLVLCEILEIYLLTLTRAMAIPCLCPRRLGTTVELNGGGNEALFFLYNSRRKLPVEGCVFSKMMNAAAPGGAPPQRVRVTENSLNTVLPRRAPEGP